MGLAIMLSQGGCLRRSIIQENIGRMEGGCLAVGRLLTIDSLYLSIAPSDRSSENDI